LNGGIAGLGCKEWALARSVGRSEN
jgi:hypothetical protein